MPDFTRHLTTGGRQRFYELRVPASYVANPNQPAPLVLCFHGGGSYPGGVRWESRFDEVAEANGFLVAYPGGTNRRWPRNKVALFWNDGRKYPDGSENTVDDVGFVGAILDDLRRAGYAFDSQRVYAAGYSNGAQFAYRLAQQMTAKLAAVACVAGQRGPAEIFGNPPLPISVMQFSGWRDVIAPYNGGVPAIADTEFVTDLQPAQDCARQWAEFNGCGAGTTTAVGQATKTVATSQAGTEVVFWTLKDGGHTWPGGNAESWLLGPVNHDVDAAAEMWSFFSRHRRA